MANVEPDLRPALLGNVVLTGGGTMMQGMSDRINNELQKQFPAVRAFSFFTGVTMIHILAL